MTLTERIKSMAKMSSADRHEKELLLPKDVFRRIIDRERDRSNRTGEIFSLAVFLFPAPKKLEQEQHHLIDTISQRIRSIDAFGWLDSNHVGVLLPETEAGGAHKFVKKIFSEIQHEDVLSNYEIFTYPSEFLTNPENISLTNTSGHVYNRISQSGGRRHSKTKQQADYMFCLTKRILKRGFDFLGAGILLLVFSPLFLFIAIFIKLTSPGPAFFKQQRIGYGGHPFTFLKFRTMRQNADAQQHQAYLAQLIKGDEIEDGPEAPMTKLDHDPQIIPFGNILRKSCLDELPQLINVLRGDMSLVGPRPPIPYEVKVYNSWHRGRFNALPGMTGLWQVSGKNNLSFREMVRLDIRYSRERSMLMDIKILFRTPMVIIEQLMDILKSKSSRNGEGVRES